MGAPKIRENNSELKEILQMNKSRGFYFPPNNRIHEFRMEIPEMRMITLGH
jgi:hypothetical protein